jgi:hypothetical protein
LLGLLLVEDETAVSGITTNNTKTKYVRISRSPKVVLAYDSETKDRGSKMQNTLALLFLLYIENTRKMENTSVLQDCKPNKFLFGSKWTMFYNAALGTMQGKVPIILL